MKKTTYIILVLVTVLFACKKDNKTTSGTGSTTSATGQSIDIRFPLNIGDSYTYQTTVKKIVKGIVIDSNSTSKTSEVSRLIMGNDTLYSGGTFYKYYQNEKGVFASVGDFQVLSYPIVLGKEWTYDSCCQFQPYYYEKDTTIEGHEAVLVREKNNTGKYQIYSNRGLEIDYAIDQVDFTTLINVNGIYYVGPESTYTEYATKLINYIKK